jgi:pyruvate,orthophosphate dikinase
MKVCKEKPLEFKSEALKVNLEDYYVDVVIDERYAIILDVFSKYYGLKEGLKTFLKELSHPYKNFNFIVGEARKYSLDYFHLFNSHPQGTQAARLFTDIFFDSIETSFDNEVRADAVDNLLLFVQKIIKNADFSIEKFSELIAAVFDHISQYDEDIFFLFVKSYYRIPRLALELCRRAPENLSEFKAVNGLLIKYYRSIYAYLLQEEDPKSWFVKKTENNLGCEKMTQLFTAISHEYLKELRGRLNHICQTRDMSSKNTSAELVKLPEYDRFVESYRHVPQKLLALGKDNSQGNQWKVLFLFHIMNIPGLSMLHEESLRDINRTISWLIDNESPSYIRKLIEKTFVILKVRIRQFPETALDCVLNMGKGVYKTDEIDLVNDFIECVIDLGFQAPMIGGVGDDWQLKVNKAHIQNIRTWLELIELNPKGSTRLISYLIIHLSLCGVFIKDTDLFPRDITRLLNSHIGPVYNLINQLARLFPVYFNDIGAEGELRDISTKIDEISNRKDILIHFLRKRTHVESSNRVIGLMEAIAQFWETREKKSLEFFLPPNLFHQVDAHGPYIDGIHQIFVFLRKAGIGLPKDLVTIKEEEVKRLLEQAAETGIARLDLERTALFISLYKLLYQKYNLTFVETGNYLASLKTDAFPDLAILKDVLDENVHKPKRTKTRLLNLLNYLETLKKILLSDTSYEIREDIYKKRHFTVDIPSMYGSYHELKFDALGLSFRIQSLVNILFEELVEDIDLSLITKATFHQIFTRLRLFSKALKLNGITSKEIERQMDLLAYSLEVKGFSFTQYLDIFKGFTNAVKNIINDYFHNVHESNLNRILDRISYDHLLEKFNPANGALDLEKQKHRISEIFFRDQIAFSLGLPQLDLFLSRILATLYQQAEKLHKEKLRRLLIYDPKLAVTPISQANTWVQGMIYLGNKGSNLITLYNYGLPVPPGFIITTEIFRYRDLIDTYSPARNNFKEQVTRELSALEKRTGMIFGDPANPLVLSVRSGSAISQPGMLDTFIDVGINEKIAAGIAHKTGNGWFAWDNYRRFLQSLGMAMGLERDDFDAVIEKFKEKWKVSYKRGFSDDQMQEVALSYKQLILDARFDAIDDPLEQLYFAIKTVFDSWESSKAKTYRRIIGISDDWGTAVTVQQMVFGNISSSSGSGVIFTHNPRWAGDRLRLWGDFTLGNQGEDVVAGLVTTLPVSIIQQDIEMRETDITLETHFPIIYQALTHWATYLIEKEGWSPQEIEFTFESPAEKDLYFLQTRDMAIRERIAPLRFDLGEKLKGSYLGHGIGVSGGAMSGQVVFSLDEIMQKRIENPDTSLILVRRDTVPDDIREIHASDGLLTARGGLTSHAAVVAHRLGKICVVGCSKLECNEKEKSCVFDDTKLKSGDYISIDGQEGSVYKGIIDIIK